MSELDRREEAVNGAEERAHEYLRCHHARLQPDPGFVNRVTSRLQREPVEILGWAALRLIPASLALVAVLIWFAVQAPPPVQTASAVGSSGDPIGWILEEPGALP
jgi:hypothetical protein